MEAVQLIDQRLLDQVSALAKQSPRLRKNYNFHTHEQDASHRLLNAIEPGSYVQPHRHLDTAKDETMVCVRGKLGFIGFNEAGEIVGKLILTPGGSVVAINIPHGTYHSLVALEPDTVFFESKAGPYAPLTQEEKASWAPEEGTDEAGRYQRKLRELFNM